MRLQKYMAEAGVGSRRQCEEYIRQGRVSVDGETAEIGCAAEAGQQVALDGRIIENTQRRVVLLFYKPRGVVCTAHDPEGRKTVQAYFQDVPERLYNVGRLDIYSEGLLVMTNDGALTERLTHPRYEVEKTYYVVCDGELAPQEVQALRDGVQLEDGMTAPARVERLARTKTGQTSLSISIHEGRNRQVRRMVEAVGHKTLLLKRERIGDLTLQNLRPGEWRACTQRELAWLDMLIKK